MPVQCQVTQAHVFEVTQARSQLLQKEISRLVQRRGQVQAVDEPPAAVDGQQHQVVQAEAWQFAQSRIRKIHAVWTKAPVAALKCLAAGVAQRLIGIFTRAGAPQQRVRLETRPTAVAAGRIGPIFGEQHAHVHLVGLALQPFEKTRHAVPHAGPAFLPVFPFGLTIEHPGTLRGCQIAKRHIQRNTPLFRILFDVVLAVMERRRLPGTYGAFSQRFGFIGNDQAVINANDAAKAAAGVAGAQRRVEGKQAGHRVGIMDIAIGAMQVGGETPGCRWRFHRRFGARGHRGGFPVKMDVDLALSDLEGGLDRLKHASAFRR